MDINDIRPQKDEKVYISGGRHYHGTPKSDIEIGVGRGNLNISKHSIEEWL